MPVRSLRRCRTRATDVRRAEILVQHRGDLSARESRVSHLRAGSSRHSSVVRIVPCPLDAMLPPSSTKWRRRPAPRRAKPEPLRRARRSGSLSSSRVLRPALNANRTIAFSPRRPPLRNSAPCRASSRDPSETEELDARKIHATFVSTFRARPRARANGRSAVRSRPARCGG